MAICAEPMDVQGLFMIGTDAAAWVRSEDGSGVSAGSTVARIEFGCTGCTAWIASATSAVDEEAGRTDAGVAEQIGRSET
jgi:hypothetical protein